MSVFLLLTVTACSSSYVYPEKRLENINSLTQLHNWTGNLYHSSTFVLQTFFPNETHKNNTNKVLTVFLEGDGYAWVSTTQASTDPSPMDNIVIQMAINSSYSPKVYISRPCQFTKKYQPDKCDKKYWTHSRYSQEVVNDINQAISHFKTQSNTHEVRLIGYSGGGTIAALIAANRNDVKQLITVASNLDHQYWTELHHIDGLSGSLNPIEYSHDLEKINQIHFVGKDDKNVPVEVINSLVKNYKTNENTKVILIEGYDHTCCWKENWTYLEKTYLQGSLE